MSDRELLKMAAKAAGIEIEIKYDAGGKIYAWLGNPVWNEWNPLTDDGDALRLAVNLGLDVDQFSGWVEVWTAGFDGFIAVDYSGDTCAATRRAITRAAAEIGRAMQ